jgi:23S rRNA (cytidine1920-2'-O)/16S rRNA (cytidine1409-2'-O)-methyltransferase
VTARHRLDAALVHRGLAETRSRAQALVMAGRVMVDGVVVDKAGAQVGETALIEVIRPPRFVSRGGDKLETGIVRWQVTLAGERCMDVGASTGGFTDCLLQHGAAEVIALDVGRGQLHERLAANPAVHRIDQVNARGLRPQQLPYSPTFLTVDVSFISLRLVLPAAVACAQDRWRALVLVKPQFEAGRERVRGGVVRDPAVRRQVLHDLCDFAISLPAVILGVCDSSHPGPAGNREYLLYLASHGHPVAEERQADVNAEIRDAVGDDGQGAGHQSGGGDPRPPPADR